MRLLLFSVFFQSLESDETAQTGTWISLKQGFDDVDQALRNMSRKDAAWLVVACLLTISSVVLCICMCRSRPQNGKRSCCCCCCSCLSSGADEEEYYALLDTGASKVKVIASN